MRGSAWRPHQGGDGVDTNSPAVGLHRQSPGGSRPEVGDDIDIMGPPISNRARERVAVRERARARVDALLNWVAGVALAWAGMLS